MIKTLSYVDMTFSMLIGMESWPCFLLSLMIELWRLFPIPLFGYHLDSVLHYNLFISCMILAKFNVGYEIKRKFSFSHVLMITLLSLPYKQVLI